MMNVHYIGKVSFTSHGTMVRISACQCGDMRSYFITEIPNEVTCEECLKHGIFKHGYAIARGLPPSTSKRYFEEYEKFVRLSVDEVDQFQHYKYWQKIKALSMVRICINDDSLPQSANLESICNTLETNPDIWILVMHQFLSNQYALGTTTAYKLWQESSKDEAAIFNELDTAIDEVNYFRKNEYRIPEFQTNRLIPSHAEMQYLSRENPQITDFDAAIDYLNKKLSGNYSFMEMKNSYISEVAAFSILSILAESFLRHTGSSKDYIFKCLIGTIDSIDNSFAVYIQESFNSFASGKNAYVVDIFDNQNEDEGYQAYIGFINKYLANINWFDTTPTQVAFDAARITIRSEKFANSLTGSEVYFSKYETPRGPIIKIGNNYRRSSYFQLFNKIKSGATIQSLLID